MSKALTNKAGRRSKEKAEENRNNIITFLAEEGEGKSQNQIFQALRDTTNWSTIRRDLAILRNKGFLSIEKGMRGAILHYLKSKGLLRYLSQYGQFGPKNYMIHAHDKDVDAQEFFRQY